VPVQKCLANIRARGNVSGQRFDLMRRDHEGIVGKYCFFCNDQCAHLFRMKMKGEICWFREKIRENHGIEGIMWGEMPIMLSLCLPLGLFSSHRAKVSRSRDPGYGNYECTCAQYMIFFEFLSRLFLPRWMRSTRSTRNTKRQWKTLTRTRYVNTSKCVFLITECLLSRSKLASRRYVALGIAL
jgi:hypothetical protein